MINLMVANYKEGNRRNTKERLLRLLNAQIENSVDLEWSKDSIVLLTNFPYEFMGVTATQTDLNETCLTGSKVFAVQKYFQNLNNGADPVVWAHDLDCWQNVKFPEPDFKDIGIARYSNSKYNGGSLFWKKSGVDILDEIINQIVHGKQQIEEPTLNKVLKSNEFKDRVTVVDNTFNVGCSGYVKRYRRSSKSRDESPKPAKCTAGGGLLSTPRCACATSRSVERKRSTSVP